MIAIQNKPMAMDIIHGPQSPLIEIFKQAALAARTSSPIFISGESGTGKEKIAQYLHRCGPTAQGPFIAVNCAAIPANLIESELFGHRKGAFTGAISDNLGKFRSAHGGTLFLDEIGDMPKDIQSRLLRVLQEKIVTPLGESKEYPVNFKLICATHHDLKKSVAEGTFRQDLFYRLDVIRLTLPPLRERKEDIPYLVRHFLHEFLPADLALQSYASLPKELLTYDFPGNIRELKNLIERFAVLQEIGFTWQDIVRSLTLPLIEQGLKKGEIQLSGSMQEGQVILDLDKQKGYCRNSRLTNQEILQALENCNHHRAQTSAFLGISRRALQYRLAKMG